MNRTDFHVDGLKVLALAELAAGFARGRLGEKAHQVLDLLGTAFHDAAKFEELCDLLGLPPELKAA